MTIAQDKWAALLRAARAFREAAAVLDDAARTFSAERYERLLKLRRESWETDVLGAFAVGTFDAVSRGWALMTRSRDLRRIEDAVATLAMCDECYEPGVVALRRDANDLRACADDIERMEDVCRSADANEPASRETPAEPMNEPSHEMIKCVILERLSRRGYSSSVVEETALRAWFAEGEDGVLPAERDKGAVVTVRTLAEDQKAALKRARRGRASGPAVFETATSRPRLTLRLTAEFRAEVERAASPVRPQGVPKVS